MKLLLIIATLIASDFSAHAGEGTPSNPWVGTVEAVKSSKYNAEYIRIFGEPAEKIFDALKLTERFIQDGDGTRYYIKYGQDMTCLSSSKAGYICYFKVNNSNGKISKY